MRLSGRMLGRVRLTALASKLGYDLQTVRFCNTLLASVVSANPAGNRGLPAQCRSNSPAFTPLIKASHSAPEKTRTPPRGLLEERTAMAQSFIATSTQVPEALLNDEIRN